MRLIVIINFLIFCGCNSTKSINVDYLFSKGSKEYESENYEKAIGTFTQGIESSGKTLYKFHSSRAYCYYETLQIDKAMSDVAIALKASVNDETSKWTLGHSYKLLGEIYAIKRENNKELEAYLEAERFLPNDTELLTNIGYCKINFGDYNEGITYLSKVVKINPKDAYAYNNRALGYIKLKELESALDDLEKSMQLTPDNPYLLKNYGLYYLEIQKKQKACDFFQEALHDKFEEWWDDLGKKEVVQLIKNNCDNISK